MVIVALAVFCGLVLLSGFVLVVVAFGADADGGGAADENG